MCDVDVDECLCAVQVGVNIAMQLPCAEMGKVYVRLGLYSGVEPLCHPAELDTKETIITCPKWHEWVTFPIALCDLPLSAKLCLAVFAVSRKQRKARTAPRARSPARLILSLLCLVFPWLVVQAFVFTLVCVCVCRASRRSGGRT